MPIFVMFSRLRISTHKYTVNMFYNHKFSNGNTQGTFAFPHSSNEIGEKNATVLKNLIQSVINLHKHDTLTL